MVERASILNQANQVGDWLALYMPNPSLAHGPGSGQFSASRNTRGRGLESRRALERIGDFIWSSSDSEDFRDRLESVIADDELNLLSGKAAAALTNGTFREAANFFELAAALTKRLGQHMHSRIIEGGRYGYAAAVAVMRGATAAPILLEPEGGGSKFDYSFVYSPNVPPKVSECLLAGFDARVCLCALAELALSNRKPPKWLADLVVDTWVERERKFLLLLASLKPEYVPELVIPEQERFSISELEIDLVGEAQAFESFIGLYKKSVSADA